MKVLVVGGGGREHALVWKLAQSEQVTGLWCAPGNAGTAELATNVDIAAEDLDGLCRFARDEGIDLTVVGPEAPLVAGIADLFADNGLAIFGPSAAAAQLEGSKSHCRDLLSAHDIPGPWHRTFTEADEAKRFLSTTSPPVVVKADGLAAGKGVVVCETAAEAIAAVDRLMVERALGEAGATVVVEERLVGQEASLIVFTDGENVAAMVPSQDHKRAHDGDQGPNTGGMGCYSPVPAFTEDIFTSAMRDIILPTIHSLRDAGTPYQGALYAGLMLTDDGPKVLEYNCRFGDPETQVVLPRLQSDLAPILQACADGDLNLVTPRWSQRKAVCVVVASGGYPGSYEKGKPISGLDQVANMDDVIVFHAGTALQDGQVVTSGGRVLGVTALGDSFPQAIDAAYAGVHQIEFEGAFHRTDIGQRAVAGAA